MTAARRALSALALCSLMACAPAPPVLEVGGDFTLTDHDGRPFQLASLRGQVVVVFFGYTYCPDVCPTTLSKLSAVTAKLGRDGDRVTTLYVSVDPQRDTPSVMKEHLGMFGVRAIGLTGTEADVARVASQFGAAYEIEPAESEAKYTVAHTTTLYVLDRDGRTRFLLPYAATVDDVVASVRRLL